MYKTKPHKAYVATALSFVAGIVVFWIADTDPFTAKEFAQAAVTSAIGSGIIGGATYAKNNPPDDG